MDEADARRARNDARVAHLAQHGLSHEDALSAALFLKEKTGQEPEFDEAVEFCREIKARYPFRSIAEILEAGLIALESGFQHGIEIGDAADFERRIRAHVTLDPQAVREMEMPKKPKPKPGKGGKGC